MMSHASATCDLKVHLKMVGDKKPDEVRVMHKCKYKCLYQRYYMILCSYRAQIPVLIIISNQSFLESLDPKDEGSKLLQNVSSASHLKDSNLHQHYHKNPKFHNACVVSLITQLSE
jgi:hypothetical protein